MQKNKTKKYKQNKEKEVKKMKKKIVSVTLAMMMCLSPVTSVYADREDDLREEQAWTNDQLNSMYSRMDDLYAQKQQLENEINTLDANLVNVMVSIQTLETDIANKQTSIENTQKDLEKAQKAKDKQYEAMKKRIQYLYEKGGNAAWFQMMMNSENLTDLLNNAEYTQKMYEYDRQSLEKYANTITQVQQLGEKYQQEKADMESMKQEQEAEQTNLQTTIDSKRASSADCDNEIAYAQQMANEYASLIQEQQAEIEQIVAEKEAAEEAARAEAERIAAEQAEAEAAAAEQEEADDVQYDEDGNIINNNEENIKEDKKQEPEVLYERKEQYTLEDLIGLCTRLNNKNEENKNKQLDIKALELKITNLSKKIENAELYIKEIEKHKKSIFEFWKFTNKDELPSLQEGDIEEESHKEKIEKYFDYEEDIEDFGKKADELQRRKLSKNETDAVFAVKQAMNSIKALDSDSEDLKQEIDLLKKEYEKNIEYINMKDFNIFGSMVEDKTKIKVINNKKHREIEKDKYKILNINSNSDVNLYKDNLKNYLKLINEAFGKISLCRNISVYKLSKEELCKLEIFDINPKKEMQNVKNKEVMYKLNLQEGTPILYYSNIIFYENFNKTLPLGMNLSTQILLDIDKLEFELIKESEFNINIQKNQFDFEIKKVKVKEYNVKGKNKE